MKKITLFALAVVLFASANAQDNIKTQNVTIHLADQIEVSIASTTTQIDFTTLDNYANGVTKATGAQLNVRSNRNWTLTAQPAAANFTYSGTSTGAGASTSMPVAGVLAVKVSSAGSYQGLVYGTPTTIESLGLRGNSNPVTVSYQATPGFGYDAGDYTVGVIFTATAR